jgi:hypothetical protein
VVAGAIHARYHLRSIHSGDRRTSVRRRARRVPVPSHGVRPGQVRSPLP